MNHIQYGISGSGSKIVHAYTGFFFNLLKCFYVADCKVYNMDVITHAGTGGGGIIVAVDMDLFQLAHRHLGDVGHQVVGDAVGVLADFAGRMRADGIEVAEQDGADGLVGGALTLKDAGDDALWTVEAQTHVGIA